MQYLFLSLLIFTFYPSSLNKDSEVYQLHIEKPSESEVYNIDDQQLIEVKGYFHDAELLVPHVKDGINGYKLIKPFSYVREKNNSLGSPAWQAFDAILVEVEWVSDKQSKEVKKHSESPYFTDSETIKGKLVKLYSSEESSSNAQEILTNGFYDEFILWEFIQHQIRNSDLPPCGINNLPLYIELIK